MRVLQVVNDEIWTLTKDLLTSPGPYAILSHTWGADEDEISLEDMGKPLCIDKAGYKKLKFCTNQASKDGLEYFWIDTCCIDRTNHVELSEAITSMFRWYRQATKCYVYLPDVSADSELNRTAQNQWEPAFRNSRWFTRGWTLQELLAPTSVEFFSREGMLLGSKKTLEILLHEITQIPISALRGEPLSQFPVEERLRWTKKRNTRKVEDRAYCLLGIFDVSMSLRYGEGEKAVARLEAKVKGSPKGASQHGLIKWLAPSRPQEFHAKASIVRHPGTGSFFLEWSLSTWLEEEPGKGSLMWITGKSGTGKTTLFSRVVEATKEFIVDMPAQAFAYHYCAFSDPESQKVINILGSIVAQLSTWRPDILKDVAEVFERDSARHQEKTLQVWELEQVLVRYSRAFNTVVFLIDALNESKDLSETLASIIRLLQQLPNLKVLVTSTTKAVAIRADQAVSLTEIQMDPDDDIQNFVEFQLLNHNNLRDLSSDCKGTIRSTLIGQADQSFRWVSLTMNNISKQRTGKAVLKALAQAPKNLNETYAQMLRMVPTGDRAIAREALLWLSSAMRPLTLQELSEAVVLDDTATTLDQESRLHRPEVILDICHGLVEYDRHSSEVKLAHSSVKEYLLSGHNETSDDSFFKFEVHEGHRTLTSRCLTYLLFDDFGSGVAYDSSGIKSRDQAFPLYQYAIYHWGQHASFATKEEWRLARKLFSTQALHRGGNYGAWASHLAPKFPLNIAVNTEPLYYAAAHGMVPVIRELLSSTSTSFPSAVNIESPGGRHGSTALQVACFRGQKEAAEFLVNAGADFWTPDRGSTKPAWFWAQLNGWTTIVDRMLQLRPSLTGNIRVEQQDARWAKIVQEMMGVKV